MFITSNRKLHLFDNFWTLETQNTEYNYKYVENYIYHIVLAKIYKVSKIYKVYII